MPLSTRADRKRICSMQQVHRRLDPQANVDADWLNWPLQFRLLPLYKTQRAQSIVLPRYKPRQSEPLANTEHKSLILAEEDRVLCLIVVLSHNSDDTLRFTASQHWNPLPLKWGHLFLLFIERACNVAKWRWIAQILSPVTFGRVHLGKHQCALNTLTFMGLLKCCLDDMKGGNDMSSQRPGAHTDDVIHPHSM